MEHTGLYSYLFEQFLHSRTIAFAKVNALAIKRSIGLTRGKSDKIDARRIARYGCQWMDTLRVQKPADKALQRLKLLQANRDRLVKHRAALRNALTEYDNIHLSKQDLLMQTHVQLIKQFDRQIEKIETEIETVIAEEQSLANNYRLLQSIKGIGKTAAVTTIIKTENFTRFSAARKFACYCGTAPFEHTSGSSIRGKDRVSHLADKRMKSLLDCCAKSAIQHDEELKQYYQKRVEMGKSKMSTINIVRNKLLYRMFAVIKRQSPFVDHYLLVA